MNCFPLELPANQQCQSEEARRGNRIIGDVSSADTVIESTFHVTRYTRKKEREKPSY